MDFPRLDAMQEGRGEEVLQPFRVFCVFRR